MEPEVQQPGSMLERSAIGRLQATGGFSATMIMRRVLIA